MIKISNVFVLKLSGESSSVTVKLMPDKEILCGTDTTSRKIATFETLTLSLQ
jgi:hypothetical protein